MIQNKTFFSERLLFFKQFFGMIRKTFWLFCQNPIFGNHISMGIGVF